MQKAKILVINKRALFWRHELDYSKSNDRVLYPHIKAEEKRYRMVRSV